MKTRPKLSIDSKAKSRFWKVVEECLVKLHHLKPQEAQSKTRGFRAAIESDKEKYGDMIYHDEPFYVACDLADLVEVPNQEQLLSKTREEYSAILHKIGW